MPKIHITGKKLPKAKSGLSVDSEPCPKGYVRVGKDCIKITDLSAPVYATNKVGVYSYKFDQSAKDKADKEGRQNIITKYNIDYDEGANERFPTNEAMTVSRLLPESTTELWKTNSYLDENYKNPPKYDLDNAELFNKFYEDKDSYKIVNGKKTCNEGYINVDGSCVKDFGRNFTVYEIPGHPGFYTSHWLPDVKRLPAVDKDGNIIDDDYDGEEIVVYAHGKYKRKHRWYDGIIAGFRNKKLANELLKLADALADGWDHLFKDNPSELSRGERRAVNEYWKEALKDPDVKERVMFDPIGYQMLRLAAFREAGVSNAVMKEHACVQGFGYHWDEEKQTCVEDEAPFPGSGERSIRTIRPDVYQPLFGVELANLKLTDHENIINSMVPKGRRQAAFTLPGKGGGVVPFYGHMITEKTGGYNMGPYFNRLIDPSEAFDEDVDVIKLIKSSTNTKNVEKINQAVTQYLEQDRSIDEAVHNTIKKVQKEGLGYGDNIIISPGQNYPTTKNLLFSATAYAPGNMGEDARLHIPRLYDMINTGNNNDRDLNTSLFLSNQRAQYNRNNSTGNVFTDFFRDVKEGTINDFLSARQYGRLAYDKWFPGMATKTQQWIDKNLPSYISDFTRPLAVEPISPKTLNGYSIDSPTIIASDVEANDRSTTGLFGASYAHNPYFAIKQLAKDLEDIKKDPTNASAYGRSALDLGNSLFQTLLTVPVVSLESSPAKFLTKSGGKFLTKESLQLAGKSLKQPFVKTIGNYGGKSLIGKSLTALGTPLRAVENFYFNPLTKGVTGPVNFTTSALFGKRLPFGFAFKAGEHLQQDAFGNDLFSYVNDVSGFNEGVQRLFATQKTPTPTEQVTGTDIDQGVPSFLYREKDLEDIANYNIATGKAYLNDRGQKNLYRFFPKEFKNKTANIYNIRFNDGKNIYRFNTKNIDPVTGQPVEKIFLNTFTGDYPFTDPSAYDYQTNTFNFGIDPEKLKEYEEFINTLKVNKKYGGSVRKKRK